MRHGKLLKFRLVDASLGDFQKAYSEFRNYLEAHIINENCVAIAEIGAGANPYLSKEFVEKHGIKYTLIDIDSNELAKAKGAYFNIICLDLVKEEYKGKLFDLVFSKMLLEHLPEARPFHSVVKKILNPQGSVLHFFATLYGIPSLVNFLLPDFITDKLLFYLQKRDPLQQGKFKAYYSQCLGPTKKNIRFWQSLNYDLITYRGFIGHGYLSRFRILKILEHKLSLLLLKFNSPYLCSVAYIHATTKSNSHN